MAFLESATLEETSQLCVAALVRQVGGRLAITVPGLGASTCLEEVLHNSLVAEASSIMQSCIMQSAAADKRAKQVR